MARGGASEEEVRATIESRDEALKERRREEKEQRRVLSGMEGTTAEKMKKFIEERDRKRGRDNNRADAFLEERRWDVAAESSSSRDEGGVSRKKADRRAEWDAEIRQFQRDVEELIHSGAPPGEVEEFMASVGRIRAEREDEREFARLVEDMVRGGAIDEHLREVISSHIEYVDKGRARNDNKWSMRSEVTEEEMQNHLPRPSVGPHVSVRDDTKRHCRGEPWRGRRRGRRRWRWR